MKNSTTFQLPALLVVGGGLVTTLATAIELGEINVESSLGQPLRASISYALAPNEQIFAYCVSLKPGFAANGLPAVTRADVSVANGVILLTGDIPVREPLMTARLDIACPYTAKLSREYMLFIDPVQTVRARSAPAAPSQQPAAATSSRPASSTTRRRVGRPPGPPIDASVRYRVQPGDSLSRIAQRIENRTINLWSAVAQIFDANPNAFKDNDPNRLMAGKWLVIPDFNQQASFPEQTEQADPQPELSSQPMASQSMTAQPENATHPVAQDADGTLYPGVAALEVVEIEETARAPYLLDETLAEEIIAAPVIAEPVVAAPVIAEPTIAAPIIADDVHVGDVIFDGAVAVDIPDDTAVLEPASAPLITDIEPADIVIDIAPTSPSPNVPVANIITADQPASPATDWVLWLLGAGIAVVTGLLAFGLRRRDRSSPAPVTTRPEHPMRRRSDGDTERMEIIPRDADEFEDDSPTQENLALDADLEIGTGLENSLNIDVAQDFGYEVSTHLDLELPEEPDEEEAPATEIIAPLVVDEDSILESEMLPDDDNYDMSVILDATKMPQNDDVTERDLRAVVVESDDDSLISNDYTVSKELEYDILEQDYEDELTATQALIKEVEKAAVDIVAGMHKDMAPEDETSELPLASVTELDITTKMPATDDDASSEADYTGVTQEMIADEKTIEMPVADGDETVEMTIEAGKIDTKAG